jgi:hypothetical protein
LEKSCEQERSQLKRRREDVDPAGPQESVPGGQSLVNHTSDLKLHAAGQDCVHDSEDSGDDCGDGSRGHQPRDNKRQKTAHQLGEQRQQRDDDAVVEEGEYEVEQIPDTRIYRKNLEYRVDWRGYEPDPTWYRASGFKKSPYKLLGFHRDIQGLILRNISIISCRSS